MRKIISAIIHCMTHQNEEQQPSCFGDLRYTHVYAENDCYSCPFLESCTKKSHEKAL